MVTREEIRGHWNEVKGRLQEHWGQLTDHDLQQARGNAEQLIGTIQRKTGATRQEIERFLDRAVESSSSMFGHASEAAHYYADEAGQAIRHGYDQAATSVSDLSRRIDSQVRANPSAALAVAFGIGVAAGALLLFNRRR